MWSHQFHFEFGFCFWLRILICNNFCFVYIVPFAGSFHRRLRGLRISCSNPFTRSFKQLQTYSNERLLFNDFYMRRLVTRVIVYVEFLLLETLYTS